ncbi:HAD superfamily hydrolase (TIGR01509 family) [Roseinatronobacter thiooxidans]|uniref:HAD superfamily hydrolase (TIGR01509 family) n=1 Tax=Roseinatronobacter thiooxidans TaxID=121821 RepID=A0A2W7QP57_9RHOB|nr:HAD-IA family hydrolase [Roseinatronobacter thiooxidans]PZX45657.1 HAD superfamily hydrolase (TIGR01509 family) [Roseinatronobacter thiooxidans]
MTPALVIFDCDGVIVDSEPLTHQVLRDDLAAHGLDMTVAQVTTQFIGGTMSGVAQKARAMGAALPTDWVDGFYAKLYQQLAQHTPLIAGIEQLLDRLDDAAIPYCIASNGRMAKMRVTMGQHPALWARVQGRMFSAEHVPAPKPAPDLFLYAAQTLGATPADCVVIEDSATGARAARSAAMRCFGYAPHDTGAHLSAEGAQVFQDMTQLPALLRL